MRFLYSIGIFFLVALVPAQIPLSGLVGAWPFSGNPNDVSGSNNHGSVFGGATLIPDRCGNPNSAYQFNGLTSYIQMLSTGPVGNASRSISFWAKTTHTQVSSPRSAFDYGTALGAGDSYQIVWSYCALGVGLDVSNQALIRGNACLYNNTWHHIVAVYNSSLSNVYSTVVYYIDGVAQPLINCNVSGTGATINTGTVFPITIGRGATSATRYFNGAIDDVYLYNRPLTAAEVQQLYTVLPVCPPPISGNNPVCPGSQNVYSVSPISNATYTWSLPSGWSGSSSTHTILITAGSLPGTLSVTASSSCGIFPTSTLALTPYFLTPLNVVSSNSITCSGVGATLTVTGSNTYTWFPGGSTGNLFPVNPALTTIYTVVSTNTSNSCSQSSTFTQSVVSNPTVTAVSAGSVACNGNTLVLTGGGANSYTWLPVNFNGSLLTVAPLSNSTYTLIGLTPFGCTASTTHSVSVPPALSLSIAAASFTACPGNPILLNANLTGGSPGYSYSWSGSGGNLSSANYQSAVPSLQTVTLVAQDNHSCTALATTTIQHLTVGALNTSTVDACLNTPASLTVSGAASYTWTPSNSTGNTFTLMAASPAAFTINATTATGCLLTATTSLFIKPVPNLSFNTFSITCGSLGSATAIASGGTGPFSYTWTPTGQSNSVATGLFPGIYTLTLRDAGTGCVFTPTTVFLPLVPLTGTVSATPSIACNGIHSGTAGIALAGGSGNQSYTWSSLNGVQSASVAGNLAAGINTVQVIDALTFCSVTHTFYISQPPALTLQIAFSSPSVCLGGSIHLTGNNSGGISPYTYTWQPGVTGNTNAISETSSGIYNYTLLSRDANLCISQQTINLSFVSNPTVTVSDVSICPMQNASLNASGASTYTWLPVGNTGSVMVQSPSVTTHYTVIGSALSCTASSSASIILKPIPVATASNNGPACTGLNVQLFSSGGTPNWSGPLGFGSALPHPSLTNVQFFQSGVYHLTVTAPNSCTASASTAVSIHPVPFLSATGNTICEGSTLQFNSNAVSGTTFSWTGPNNYYSSQQNPLIPNALPSSTGFYTLFILSTQSCTNAMVVQASVTPMPTLVVNHPPSVCLGDSLFLSASGALQYLWAGPFSYYNANATVTLANMNPAMTWNFSLTTNTGPCQVNTIVPITVFALPQVSIGSNSLICELSTLSLQASPAQSYTWTGPQGFISNLQNPIIFGLSINSGGLYGVTVKDTNGCQNGKLINIHVLPAPVISASGATVCLGNSAQLSVTGGVYHAWTGPAGLTSTLSSIYIPTVGISNSGTYSVIATGANQCTAQTSVLLSGLPYPLPQIQFTGNNKVCEKSTLLITGHGGVYYQWNGPGAMALSSQQLSLTSVSAQASGLYTLTVTNASNCVSSGTLRVEVYPLPKVRLSSTKNESCVPYCTTLSFQLDSTSAPMQSSFSMFNGQTYYTNPFSVCVNNPGVNSITTVFTDINQCTASFPLELLAYPKVQSDFDFSPLYPLVGLEPVRFRNASQGIGQTQWHWLFPANHNDTLFTQDCSYLFTQTGKFPVVLLVSNQWGCTDTVIKVITVEEDFSMYFPNTFSPNGDGLNDLFQPKGVGFSAFSLQIFDRWGALIFQTQEFTNAWDGNFKGAPCQEGSYNWKASVRLPDQRWKTYSGVLLLIR